MRNCHLISYMETKNQNCKFKTKYVSYIPYFPAEN